MVTDKQHSSIPEPYIRIVITAVYCLIVGIWVTWAYGHYLLMTLAWKHLIHLDLWLGQELSAPSRYLLASICISGFTATVTIIIPILLSKALDRRVSQQML